MRKFAGLSTVYTRSTVLIIGVLLCTVAFGLVAWNSGSAAGNDPSSPASDVETPPLGERDGTMTRYGNGVVKIEPSAFGVTGPVRDLPVYDADTVNTRRLREERRKELQREKGMTEEEIQQDDINRQNAKRLKRVNPDTGSGDGPFEDPLLRNNAPSEAPQAMPAPGLTFDGATQADNTATGIGAVLPPDVNGDVGPNHYVSSVNLVYKIFNKTGTVAAGPFATSALFSGLPAGDPCRTGNDGDPHVLYDSLADRWHISQFRITGSVNRQCVAISTTSDPTGSYYVYSYVYPNMIFNDYPKIGQWTDAYHFTFNQFNNAGNAFLGMGFLSQDRPKALAGDPTASVIYTNIATIDPNAGGGLPLDIDGIVPPPAGMAAVIAEYRADDFGDPVDGIRYYRWVPNFVTPASSTVTVLPDVALAPFDARNPSGRLDVEQLGGAGLDSIADRLMHRFAYRNLGTQASPVNSITGSFTVNVSGVNPTAPATYQAGIRWFEMRRTGDTFSVFDQGTHASGPISGATGLNNWMGSLAQDNDGNIALGFSQASTTQRANIMIAGRTGGAGGTLNEGEALFFASAGSQTSTSGRWGDYSQMSVDPVDDCTFWYTQEYNATTGPASWSTRVGRFVYPGCTPAQKGTIQGTITFCSSGLPVNQASVDATGSFNRQTIANGTYSMTVPPGTYTVSSNKGPTTTGTTTPSVTVVNGGTSTANICLQGVPALTAGTATLVSESCLPANGVIDPGETVTVAFGVTNTGAANTVNDIGTLAATGGVTAPGAAQNYGVIVAGGGPVSRNFTFTASPALACGARITATIQHQDGASNLGSLTYNLPTGALGPSATAVYTTGNIAVPILDVSSVDVPINVPDTGVVTDLNVRVRLNHTFDGDLRMSIVSPTGNVIPLATNRGGAGDNFGTGANSCAGTKTIFDDGAATVISAGVAPFAGSFRPESPLSFLNGVPTAGTWNLRIADTAGGDVGTVGCVDLDLTRASFSCCTGGATPTPTNTPTGTPTATPTATPTSTPTATPTPPPGGTCLPVVSNFTQTIPVAIPTGPSVVTSTIVVSGAGTYLTDLNLTTNLMHTFSADLDVTITSPAGTVVSLTTDNGAGNDNVFNGTVWDDDANPAGQVPYTTNNGLVTDHAYVNLTTASPLVPEEAFGAFIGENPNGTWTITISDDLAGDGGSLNSWSLQTGTLTSAPTIAVVPTVTNNTAVAIPTGPSVITSTVVVAGAGTVIHDVDLRTFITHTFAADLDVTLTSPAGTVVTLTTDNGAGNDNVFNGTIWDDDANPGGQVPYTTNDGLVTDHPYVNLTTASTLVPEEAMGAFYGQNPNGTWTITISDDLAGDGGSLDSWSLDIDTFTCVVATPTPTPSCTPGGNYVSTTSTGATIVPGTVNTGNNGDDVTTNITLPFSFGFYGQPFTSANVSSNGNLQFTSNNAQFTNEAIPTVNMNNLIGPLWDDLRTDGGGGGIFTSVSGSAPNRIFNIEWRATFFNSGAGVEAASPEGVSFPANFEIRLYETTGQIDFVYANVTGGGSSATVGLQKGDGSGGPTTYNQFSFNTASLSNGMKITWLQPTCASPSPTPTPLADLAITKTDGVTVVTSPGSTTYTIVVTNNGPAPAVDARVTDIFPAGITVDNWTCLPQNQAQCRLDGAGNINELVYIPMGGILTYTAVATIASGQTGTLVNTATVTAPPTVIDPNLANNTSTDTDTYGMSISGNVTQFVQGGPNTPLAGVLVTAQPGGATATTNAAGNYTIAGTPGTTYTLTPTMAGKVFDPTSRTVTSTGNVTGVDFIAYNSPNGIPRNIFVVNTHATPGNAVTVPIRMTSQGTEKTMAFSLDYPLGTLFTPVVTCGASTPGCVLAVNNTTPGKLGVTITAAGAGVAAGLREIANITFQTNVGFAPPNAPLTFSDTPTAKAVRDAANNTLQATYTDGFVVFVDGVESDVAGRNSGNGDVLATDVTQVRRFVANLDATSPAFNEFQRADAAPSGTFGDGVLNVADVVQSRRYASRLDGLTAAAGPAGPPAPPLGPVANPVEEEAERPATDREFRLTRETADAGRSVSLGVEYSPRGDEAGAGFTIEYNAARLTNARIELGEGMPEGTVLTINDNDKANGRIGVLIDSSTPLGTSSNIKRLITITFDVAERAPGGETRVRFTNSLVAQGVSDVMGNTLDARYTEGAVMISGPQATGTELSGRVTTADGRGIRGAQVTILDATGRARTVTTGTFGYYRFDDVAAGEAYTIGVTSRGHRFAAKTVSTTETNLSAVDFIAPE